MRTNLHFLQVSTPAVVDPDGLWQESSTVSSSASEESVWVFGMDTGACIAKSQLRHSYDLGQTSGCELCAVRPCPLRQDVAAVTRTSWVAQEP